MRAPILLSLILGAGLASAQRTRALETLAMTMAGSYTSAEQARADSSYFNIELEMTRIWHKRKDGAWLYVEQAAAETKEKPYRQRVYRLTEVNDSTFRSEIHTIRGGERFFGAYKDPLLLAQLSPDSLVALEGCAITLHRRGSVYAGSTNGRACPNARGGAAYATSEVTLRSDRMVSWDRGFDEAGKQVWGAAKGGYIFLKRRP
jgi:hypothetical protein